MSKKAVLTIDQVKKILRPQFEYLAKSHGEVLWLHSFAVWSIFSKIATRIPRFTDHDRLLLEIATLIHDIGKMRIKSQEILTGERQGRLKHTATKEEIRDYLATFISDSLLEIEDKDIDKIWEFALHHHISEDQQKDAQTPAFGIYAEAVRYADWLSSMERLDMAAIRQIQNGLEGVCKLTVFSVGRFPSPSTYCLLREATEKYRANGWEVLTILDDSVLFIGDTASIIPNKKAIVDDFVDQLIKRSFEGVSIQNRYMRYEILSGKAKDSPYGFLKSRENFYRERLGDIEAGPVLFFRTVMDMYKNSGRLTNKIKKDLPILDILVKAGGPNGITQARENWNRRQNAQKEWPPNALIIDVFNNVNLGEIMSDNDFNKTKHLKDMTSDELFDVLLRTAINWFPGDEGSILEDSISNIISLEEEIDFETFAKSIFQRYKNYKTSRRPANAL